MTPLTDAERQQLTAELAELETAYREMISGGRVASVETSGRSIAYAQGNPVAVAARIATIKRRLGLGPGRINLRPYF